MTSTCYNHVIIYCTMLLQCMIVEHDMLLLAWCSSSSSMAVCWESVDVVSVMHFSLALMSIFATRSLSLKW